MYTSTPVHQCSTRSSVHDLIVTITVLLILSIPRHMSLLHTAARSLLHARASAIPVELPEGLLSLSDAYKTHDEMILISDKSLLGDHCGWKIAATSSAVQKTLGFGPFYGPLFERSIHEGSDVSMSSLGPVFKAVEAEIAIVLSDSFPPIKKGYTAEDVLKRIECITPAIELASARITTSPLPAPGTVADFAMNGCVILGSQSCSRDKLLGGFDTLSKLRADILINDDLVSSGFGSDVLGNPLQALAWLANSLNERNKMLHKGQVVMTGAIALSRNVKSRDRLTARFTNWTGDDNDTCDVTVQLRP